MPNNDSDKATNPSSSPSNNNEKIVPLVELDFFTLNSVTRIQENIKSSVAKDIKLLRQFGLID